MKFHRDSPVGVVAEFALPFPVGVLGEFPLPLPVGVLGEFPPLPLLDEAEFGFFGTFPPSSASNDR